MKLKSLALYAIFIAAAVFVISTSNTNPTPSQRVRRNAPAPCSGCHKNQMIGLGNQFEITGFPEIIVPGETYTITVRLTSGNLALYSHPAFEFVIISGSNTTQSAGVFPCQAACGSGSQEWHIESGITNEDGTFNFARTTFPVSPYNGTNVRTWEIDWRADGVTPGDEITLYAHATIGNGSTVDIDLDDWSPQIPATYPTGTVCEPGLSVSTSATAPTCSSPLSGTATVNTSAPKYLWAVESQRQNIARGLSPGNYSVLVADGNTCETRQITVPAVLDNQAPVFTSCPSSVTLSANQAGCSRIVTYATPLATDQCNTPLTFTQNTDATIIKGIWSSNGAARSHLRLIPVDSAQQTLITDVKVGIYKSIGANAQIILYEVNPGLSLSSYTQLTNPNTIFNTIIPAMNNGVYCHTLATPFVLSPNKDLVVELRCSNSLHVRGGYTDNASSGISYFASNPGSGSIINVNNQGFPFFDDEHFYCKVNAYSVGTSAVTQISGLPSGASFPLDTTNMLFHATDAAGNITPCSFAVTITPSLISNAGMDQTICSGNVATLAGAITGTATSNTWTTSGTGTFSNANALTTTYMPSPADIASGIVTLTLTANNPSGPCPVATDQMIVNFDPNPFTANAGANQTVCTGTAASLNGQLTGTNLASWTASVPGGSFSPNANSAIVTYIPPAGFSGNIDLILTTNDPPNTCPPVSDQLTLTVEANPFSVSAGANQTVCTGTAANLNGQLTGTNLASWTASVPGGSFSPNANSAIVTYTPPAGFSGNIDLILTTNDPPNTCPPVSDQLTLTVEANPFSVSAGANQTVCTGTAANLNGQLTGTNLASWTASVPGVVFLPTPILPLLPTPHRPGSAGILISS